MNKTIKYKDWPNLYFVAIFPRTISPLLVLTKIEEPIVYLVSGEGGEGLQDIFILKHFTNSESFPLRQMLFNIDSEMNGFSWNWLCESSNFSL